MAIKISDKLVFKQHPSTKGFIPGLYFKINFVPEFLGSASLSYARPVGQAEIGKNLKII